MITIVDYGLSNLLSIRRAVEKLGEIVTIIDDPIEVMKAEKIILPGVGAFMYGMNCLNERGLSEAIICKAKEGIPILGICLGMQMLFTDSEEGGMENGLNLVDGHVIKIPEVDTRGVKQNVPHIGWDKFELFSQSFENGSILDSILPTDEVYFVHSYYAVPNDKNAECSYALYGGRRICATVQKNNVVGCQFHPEKSGEVGLRILANFLKMK